MIHRIQYVPGQTLRQDLAQTRLSVLTPDAFAGYRDLRLETVRPGTINRELGLIQHIFEVARTDWGIPVTNPIKGIRKPKADRARERRLSGDELEQLLEALKRCRNPLLGAVVRFAIATGMRRGEILNARWKDLNWELGTLRIPVTKTDVPRTIPLSFEAKQVLVELAIVWQGQDRIFPTTAQAVNLAWKRLTKRAKIVDLHFHDLRHEAISRFFERGLSIPEVALISGHKDPRMLFRYTHLKAEDVARKLNGTS
jgi:integrase